MLETPELDEGRFEELTITAQLNLIDRTVARREAVLLGSSLGGWLAALYAATHPNVERVVLMAPAFGFVLLWEAMLGPEKLGEWRRAGALPVFHYGAGRERNLRFAFLEDARRYEPYPDVHQPSLILHGTRDESVPLANSVRFARQHPDTCRLVPLSSGHELTDVMDRLWDEVSHFLALQAPPV